MGKTIRLTMAQAVAHFLKAQMTVVDGRKVPTNRPMRKPVIVNRQNGASIPCPRSSRCQA